MVVMVVFNSITIRISLFTSTSVDATTATTKYILHNDGRFLTFAGYKDNGNSVRLMRSATGAEQLQVDGTVVDVYYQNNNKTGGYFSI